MTVPTPQAGTDVRCPHCEQVVRVPPPNVPYAAPVVIQGAEPGALRVVYVAALLLGLAAAAVIYLVVFDELSEEQLVGITPFWFFPIVFGLYGFVSQRLIRLLAEGRARTLAEAARVFIDIAGHWAAVVMFPFLVLKWRSSLLVSMAAALFWAVLLWLFFEVVFPAL
ncbi:hypothetical protein [Streptomyces sp. NPDC002889]|uniref:hypothetical protein n=1 Tax=Streptomyces sp. NPDC002889 TaxID=3364669 RepID=UPI0036D14B9D